MAPWGGAVWHMDAFSLVKPSPPSTLKKIIRRPLDIIFASLNPYSKRVRFRTRIVQLSMISATGQLTIFYLQPLRKERYSVDCCKDAKNKLYFSLLQIETRGIQKVKAKALQDVPSLDLYRKDDCEADSDGDSVGH